MRPISIALSLLTSVFLIISSAALADVSRIEVARKDTVGQAQDSFSYQRYEGVVYFTLDPRSSANATITDIEYAPRNARGLVEYSADFKLLVPSDDIANGVLVYAVNNRGGMSTPPESGQTPLAEQGYTYLATGWINELAPADGRLRLHAPVVSDNGQAITGDVRYEVSVNSPARRVEIAGGNHLAYMPTDAGLRNATLSRRQYLTDPRVPIERLSLIHI